MQSHQKTFRWISFFMVMTMLLAMMQASPVSAQVSAPGSTDVSAEEQAPPVLILPVNGAQFLPGALFDLRVEVHAEELPEDFAVTIAGEAIEDFFGVEGQNETWEFGDEEDPTTSLSVIWRDLVAPATGTYTVTVTAGGGDSVAVWEMREPSEAAGAKNIILFIADGGSPAVYTATRLISRGMNAGTYNSNLVFEDFEEIGFLHTSGIDSIITDSANSISAYNTGHKTAINANGVYPDTSADALDDPRTEKLAYMVKRLRDMSVGIVTTSNWADATPNGVYGYGRDRSNNSLNAYVTQPLDEELLPEVILGGGARNMLPSSADGSRRADERDLFTEYEEAGYAVVTTATEMEEAIESEVPERLLGIFHPDNMNVWLDKHVYTENAADFPDQPDLDEMTLAALEILGQNENGFFLQVEASSIDKALHPMDFERALADTIEFDRAIAAALEWVEENSPDDTLIIVTSDHAHSYDVYGTVAVDAFNAATHDAQRRNAIRTYGDAGFPTYEDADGDYFPDSWEVSVTLAQGKVDNPVFTEDFQVSPVYRVPSLRATIGDAQLTADNPEDDPLGLRLGGNLPEGDTSSVHTLQSVPVYARGPGADCFGRVQENIEVFFCMAAALGLDPASEAASASE